MLFLERIEHSNKFQHMPLVSLFISCQGTVFSVDSFCALHNNDFHTEWPIQLVSSFSNFHLLASKISWFSMTMVVKTYRQISQMMYQPKSVGKVEDFETFTLFISLNSSQQYTYFCRGLANYRVMSAPGKISNSQPSSVFKLILLPTTSCYGLDLT